MKREKEGGEEGRRRGEARSREPYHHLLKWGMRVEEVKLPTEGGRGGAPQHGSHTHRLCISKLFPTRAIHTHTQMMMHLDRYTRNAHNTHTSQTQTYLSLHAVCRGHTDQKLNLALWLCAVSRCSLRPVECFTGALGPNTQTL